MKTYAKFLKELKDYCARRMDFLNDRNCFEKTEVYEDILNQIEKFEAERKQVSDDR
jgi:hypothetical protein